MIVTHKDIEYLSKKLELSEEKTFCLINDPEAIEAILTKASAQDLHGEEVVGISFKLFAVLSILKYSQDLDYDFNGEELVSCISSALEIEKFDHYFLVVFGCKN